MLYLILWREEKTTGVKAKCKQGHEVQVEESGDYSQVRMSGQGPDSSGSGVAQQVGQYVGRYGITSTPPGRKTRTIEGRLETQTLHAAQHLKSGRAKGSN